MRQLICLACSDRVALQGDAVRCACSRSSARHGPGGWAYVGPAMIAHPVQVHEPERRRVAERLIEVPDDHLSHRAEVEPLL